MVNLASLHDNELKTTAKTLAGLFLLAFILRLAAILFWQFDGLYGQDPYAYYQQAIAIARNLPQGRPPPLDFFWPNGYPLLVAFLMLFLGQSALAGQLATLICGAALPPLVYLLSRDLGELNSKPLANKTLTTRKEWAGSLAGLIIAVAGQPILSSVVIMADMPALFWATLSAWLVVRATQPYHNSPGRSPAVWFAAAGAMLALAIISRWIYALLLPALSLYTLLKIRHNQTTWRAALPALPGGLIILAPQLWLSLNRPEGLYHSFLRGWSPVNYLQREFEHAEGHFLYQLPMAIFYAQPAGHPAYIFPLLGLAALGGIWYLWQTRRFASLMLLLGWAGPVYLFLAGIPFQNFRFGLSLYVPLVILTGYGLNALLDRNRTEPANKDAETQRRQNFALPPGGLQLALRVIIILSLLGMLAWAYPMLDNFLTTQNQSKIIARQVEQTLPAEATLLTFGLTLTFQHYTRVTTLEFFNFDPASLKRLVETEPSLYLLLDLHNIETQWRDKAPQLNYRWLHENTILKEVAAFPPYVLFKIVTY